METLTISDNELVYRVSQGGEAAFAILHNRYRRKVVSYIYMLVKRADIAEDLAQDAFIKAYKSLRLGAYQETGKFESWLIRIAKNLVIDHYRKGASVTFLEATVADPTLRNLTSDDSPERAMMRKQRHNHLRKLVDCLPKEQKEVVLLRYYIGLSFKEIADFTDVSINTALGRMRYALINLKKKSDTIDQA